MPIGSGSFNVGNNTWTASFTHDNESQFTIQVIAGYGGTADPIEALGDEAFQEFVDYISNWSQLSGSVYAVRTRTYTYPVTETP